jgi:alpha-1,4-digalacturonate transport system substrate-binding protein
MTHTFRLFSRAAIVLAVATAGLPALSATIRVMCYQDGTECDVTNELARRFEKLHPETKVLVDTVPFKTVLEQLPMQLAAGEGPDIARLTDLGGMSRYYLDISPHIKDRAYWDTNFASTSAWLRPTPTDKGIYGFMSQLTMTGPFVNKTLFEQAKIPLPGPKATWDEWADATRRVAKATQTKAAMAWDRSGHRFAGPAISEGAEIFDAKGELTVDAGYRSMIGKFVAWNKDGTVLRDIWAGSGGSTYADTLGEFINGNVVLALSGSWQISRLQRDIGNNFDWVAVPNPCGPAACSGVPGGAAWVALKTSKAPKEVAAFLEYMASEPVYAEFTSRTGNIPAHAGLVAKGVSYPTEKPVAAAALAVFSAGVPTLSPVAYRFQGYRYGRALQAPTVSRITQAIVGELTVDQAITKLTTDMQESVRQARK